MTCVSLHKFYCMKHDVLMILAFMPVWLCAQNIAINTSGVAAHASAALDITSTSKGVLVPRMTSAQRQAISSPANGLLVFDTTTGSFWFYASGWTELSGGGFSLPYTGSASDGTSVFSITNNFNGFNYSTAILGRRLSGSGLSLTNSAGIWGDAAAGTGVTGTSDALPGVHGISQQFHGLYGKSNGGNGLAGVYGVQVSSGFTPGTSMGIWGDNSNGLGVVGTSNTGVGVYGLSNDNHGVYGYGTNINWAGIKGSHANDGGIGIHGEVINGTGIRGEVQATGRGIHGRTLGTAGKAGVFQSTQTTHNDTTFVVSSKGTGPLSSYHISNTANSANGIDLRHDGMGRGLQVILTRTSSTANAVHGFNNGSGAAVYGRSEFGNAGRFEITNIASTGHSISIDHKGLESALDIHMDNPSSMEPGLKVLTNTTSGIVSSQTADNGKAVAGVTSGAGSIGVEGVAYNGTGVKGISMVSNYPGIEGKNISIGIGGIGVQGTASGSNGRGVQAIIEAGSEGYAVMAVNLGIGTGVRAVAGNGGEGIEAHNFHPAGRAGYFNLDHPTSSYNAVEIHNSGLGNALFVNGTSSSNVNALADFKHSGTSDYAVFRNGSNQNKIRFDNTGKGFFNGGTQTGGADIAEAFDTEEHIDTYSPGDVLVISTIMERTVTKSTEPYSTLVAGVYATKPGVLMSEENIDSDLTGKVPMGVLGVIPTKVCGESGAIRSGDLLVTSSQPGMAMKGDPSVVKTGQVIGKALEHFDGEGIGMIRVLVNVR